MKFLRLVIRNLLRNKRRTFLTITSISVSLFLVTTLRTILTELNNPPETPASALRLITRHRVSLFNALPVSHKQKIAAIDGVEAVVGQLFFGGVYKDPANFFLNFSTDLDGFFTVNSDMIVADEQKNAFLKDRTGALVGNKLADRFGWKLGDVIHLKSTMWPLSPELTVRAIYEGSSDLGAMLYFHWDYFNEAAGELAGFTGTFTLKARSKEDVPRIAETIDRLFENSSYPTKTETEKGFLLGFASMLGDVQLFISSVVSVVIFAIILVAANSMAMSIRERVREIGILKALGFRRYHVLSLLMGESLILSLSGAFIGSWAARVIFSAADMAQISGGFLVRFYVTPGTLALCAGIGLIIGVVSAGIPSLNASRTSVLDALRRVV